MNGRRWFEMSKWTMLLYVIMQLCHVIQHFDGFSFFIVYCKTLGYVLSIFIWIIKRAVQQKRQFFSLLPDRTLQNVFKMTIIWSMNRPKNSEWMQFRACEFIFPVLSSVICILYKTHQKQLELCRSSSIEKHISWKCASGSYANMQEIIFLLLKYSEWGEILPTQVSLA